ncbi:MAG: hypothetical protein DRP06_03700 [Candidatus Aenigmatarchaeota archaeon]|nr:MAG: hypothetical protein DRP06_03700 [Candidatus Aenigmarchaeota archaeon]
MKSNILEGANNQIAETNNYLMQFGKEIPDPRAIEMVKEIGQYAKNRGAEVSDYVHSNYDINQLTNLLAKGVSEEELTDLYQNPIKENIDLDAKDYNFLEAGESNPYNINLKNFFELPVEEKVSYLNKLKTFGKKAIPVALAASLVATPVVSAYSTAMELPGEEADLYDDTIYFLSLDVNPLETKAYCDGFNEITRDSNKLLRNPDEITGILADSARSDKNLGEVYGEIDLSSEEFAWWISTYSKSGDRIEPDLVGLDINGDGKADKLVALYHAGDRTDDKKLYSALSGHHLTVEDSSTFVIYPFDVQKDRYKLPKNPKTSDFDILMSEAIQDMLYIEDPSNMRVLPEVTIPADELEYKTVGEILGNSDTIPISDAKVHETEIYKESIGEESAEKMVKDMKTETEKEKTNPVVYAGIAAAGGLALAAMYGLSKGKK